MKSNIIRTNRLQFTSISRKEWKQIQNTAIKVWHFEKTKNGVTPVAGEFDNTNPEHIKVSDVIKVHQ